MFCFITFLIIDCNIQIILHRFSRQFFGHGIFIEFQTFFEINFLDPWYINPYHDFFKTIFVGSSIPFIMFQNILNNIFPIIFLVLHVKKNFFEVIRYTWWVNFIFLLFFNRFCKFLQLRILPIFLHFDREKSAWKLCNLFFTNRGCE